MKYELRPWVAPLTRPPIRMQDLLQPFPGGFVKKITLCDPPRCPGIEHTYYLCLPSSSYNLIEKNTERNMEDEEFRSYMVKIMK